MGRQTRVKLVNIHDRTFDMEGEDKGKTFKPTDQFIANLEVKYHIDYSWEFDDDGDVNFRNKLIFGEPINHIYALLEIAKHYDRKISGVFIYDDNQTATHEFGIVYITEDYRAKLCIHDLDMKLETLKEMKDPVNITIVDINKRN